MQTKLELVRSDIIIFVDTNIYLDCYQRRYDNYRSLLASLSKLADIVLYTSAVHDEFRRNRVGAYTKDNKLSHVKGNIVAVEIHHGPTASEVYKAINKRKNDISTEIKSLIGDIGQLHEENIKAIASGDDDVSNALRPIIANVQHCNEDQLKRARKRKEVGNPPGKPGDPLGDQISWEQLLDAASSKKAVWIVSNDGDYTEKLGKSVVINPLLADDLKNKASSCAVHCFDNLADFFISFNALAFVAEGEKVPADVLEVAKKEFTANTAVRAERVSISSFRGPVSVKKCPETSDGVHVFTGSDLIPRPSVYGGWSYWQRCQRCGADFDTGEPYDD